MNPDELKQAAEVMRRAADGEVVEMRRAENKLWMALPVSPDNSWKMIREPAFDWDLWEYRILDFPPPPDGSAWHNPAGLNATQVGVHEGFRLTLTGENFKLEESQYWSETCKAWMEPHVNCPQDTFRTKQPLPSPKVDACEAAWLEHVGTTPVGLYGCCKDKFFAGWNDARAHFTKQS